MEVEETERAERGPLSRSRSSELAPGDESSPASSDNEPSMVVSRSRRANAGNRMSRLLQLAEAEDAQQRQQQQQQAEAGEEEEFAGIFRESVDDKDFGEDDVADEGDVSMSESSSEDEDGGPDDEQAESDLRKEERTATAKKRKRETLLQRTMRLKKIKYAPSLSALAASASQRQPVRPKKKVDRVSWLPTEDCMRRTSTRKLALENKKATHERLKAKEKHRQRTMASMQAAEERKKANKSKPMTQEERLARAAVVEKQNSSSLNRWEEAEKKRVAEQKARLAALKNRKLDGPVVTFWSGPAVWVNDNLKFVGRKRLAPEVAPESHDLQAGDHRGPSDSKDPQQQQVSGHKGPELHPPMLLSNPLLDLSSAPGVEALVDKNAVARTTLNDQSHFLLGPNADSFLDGIEYWASLPPEILNPQPPIILQPPPPSSAPAINGHSHTGFNGGSAGISSEEIKVSTPQNPPQANAPLPEIDGSVPEHAPQLPQLPQSPATTEIQSLAERTLITLSSFPNLGPRPPSVVTSIPSAPAATYHHRNRLTPQDKEKRALLKTLLGYDPFSAAAPPGSSHLSRLIGAGKRSEFAHKKNPAVVCAVTGLAAKYRDPKTGLPYATSLAFRMIRKAVSGEVGVWSSFLGAWVGPRQGAEGVPEEVWHGKGRGNEGGGADPNDKVDVQVENKPLVAA